MSNLTERPILFSGPMVKAILAGTKTQTRRVVKFPHNNPLGKWEPTTTGGKGLYRDKACTIPANEPENAAIWHTRTGDCISPRWRPGDRLWVREGLRVTDKGIVYEADKAPVANVPADLKPFVHPYRTAMLMPRWASRITLEVTSVRVERINEASDSDILCEGVESRNIYVELWNRLNEKRGYPWAKNPWVWVLEFQIT